MNIYKEKHEKRKAAVLNLLKTTKEFYDKYEKKHDSEVLGSLIKDLENEEFSIVLIGEFSAGKSTFLNALMGEKILPSFTDETTATVNFLRHKEKAQNGEEGRVYYNDGREDVLEKVDFETINKYVCTKSDIEVANKVEHLDLYLDSKFLEGNVTLVDSPGLNGTADGHREITEAQIEKSSASIFMFKADQPGSKTDFEFLRQLKNKVNTIIFVLNKIDDIKTSEGETPESVIESLKNNYKKQFPNENTMPEIWGVSAYQALVARSKQNLDYHDRMDFSEEEKNLLEEKSRMSKFENRLWQFLTQGEKARATFLSPVEKVISISNELKVSMESERELLESKNDTNEIEEKILEVKNQMDGINNSIKGITNDVSRKLNLLVDEVEESLEVKAEKLKENQIRKLDNWTDVEELIEFEKNITNNSSKEYKKIIDKCEKEFVKGIKEIIAENYEEIVEEVNENLREADFKISINTKYEPTESEFNLGIEKYENEIKELEEELAKRQEEIDGTEVSIIRTRALEREIEKIEDAMEHRKSEKRSYENIAGPTERYETQENQEEYWNKSVLGFVKDLLVGRKMVTKRESVLANKDEIDQFKIDKKRTQEEFSGEIQNLENKLNVLKENGESSEEIELIRKNIISKQRMLQKQIEDKQKEFKEKYIKQNERVLKNRKIELENYFDDICEEYTEKLTEELRNKKKIFLEMIKNTIGSSLNNQLEVKKREYELLETKLKSSQDDKEKYIQQLNEMTEEIDKIMMDAVSLQTGITSEKVDKIEQITI